MKKRFKLSLTFLHISVAVLVIPGQFACKKESNSAGRTPSTESKFSFKYNGVKHMLPFKEGTAEWTVNSTGFGIFRNDIFGGIVRYLESNCAYFEPGEARMVGPETGSFCRLTAGGAPIDSVAVYLYQSGHYTITYKNCYTKREPSYFGGAPLVYDVCDADGAFELTMVNQENKTIRITEGTFETYNFRKQ